MDLRDDIGAAENDVPTEELLKGTAVIGQQDERSVEDFDETPCRDPGVVSTRTLATDAKDRAGAQRINDEEDEECPDSPPGPGVAA